MRFTEGTSEFRGSLQRTLLATVYLPTALLSIARGVLLITIPLYSSQLGASYALIGVAVAAMSLGTLFSDIPSSLIFGRLGEKNTTMASFIIKVVGLAGLATAVSFEAIVFWTLLWGVGTALWSLSRHYQITTIVPYNYRGRASALTGGSERIGLFAGPIIGGLSISNLGYTLTFVTGMAITLGGFLLWLAWRSKLKGARPSLDENDSQIAAGSDKKPDSGLRSVVLLGVGQTIVHVVRYGRHFLIPVYGKLVLNMPDAAIGFVMGLSGILDAATAYPSGVILDKLGRGTAVTTSFTIMSIGLLSMALSSNPLLFAVSIAIIGIGNGFGSGMMLTLGADIGAEFDRRRTPRFLGAWHFMGNLGNSIGPLFLGFLAGVAGIQNSVVTLAIVGFSMAFALPKLIKSHVAAQT